MFNEKGFVVRLNHSVYYSKVIKTLIIIPNMGTGVLIAHNEVKVCPYMVLYNILSQDKTFKKIRGFQID